MRLQEIFGTLASPRGPRRLNLIHWRGDEWLPEVYPHSRVLGREGRREGGEREREERKGGKGRWEREGSRERVKERVREGVREGGRE